MIERTVQNRVRMQMSSLEFLSVGSVFGTQSPGILFAVFFFHHGLQRFHLYLESSLSQHPRACFIPLRNQIKYTVFRHAYWYCTGSTATCNNHLLKKNKVVKASQKLTISLVQGQWIAILLRFSRPLYQSQKSCDSVNGVIMHCQA